MIDLQLEYTKPLSSMQIYKILSNSIDIANEDGFLNAYTYSISVLGLAAITLMNADGYDEFIENPLDGWDKVSTPDAEGNCIIKSAIEQYKSFIDYITEIGEDWFIDYQRFLCSIKGSFAEVGNFMQDLMADLASKIDNTDVEDIQKVIGIAQDWGMTKE